MMMRRRRGEECLARLPTPCRAPRRKDPGLSSESESTQTSDSLPGVQTAEASVQTEREDPEHSEKEAEGAEGEQLEPCMPRRRSCRCGAGLWLAGFPALHGIPIDSHSRLIQAYLPDEDAVAVVDSSFLEREALLLEQLEVCGAQVAGLLANQTNDSSRSHWSAFLWR
eukprot:s981_g11.t1